MNCVSGGSRPVSHFTIVSYCGLVGKMLRETNVFFFCFWWGFLLQYRKWPLGAGENTAHRPIKQVSSSFNTFIVETQTVTRISRHHFWSYWLKNEQHMATVQGASGSTRLQVNEAAFPIKKTEQKTSSAPFSSLPMCYSPIHVKALVCYVYSVCYVQPMQRNHTGVVADLLPVQTRATFSRYEP